MAKGLLEHVNITVRDPDKTAEWLCELFGWKVRWRGEAIHGGLTVHVGSDEQYLAVYTGPGDKPQVEPNDSYTQRGGLNHVGVVVEDLDAAEKRIEALGFKAHTHADYEPGRRFYFRDTDGIEFEVVSYA